MTNKYMNVPKVEDRAEQFYVSIPIKVSLREWGKANELVEEIFKWVNQKGIRVTGPPFYRYWQIGDMDNDFDLEVGVPVGSPIKGDDRVITSSIPRGSYATLVHTGHPDYLVNSLSILEDWAKSEGIEWNNRKKGSKEIWGGRFEFYLTDPVKEPDLEKWSIELAYQIKDDA